MKIIEINTNEIKPNPHQPRKEFDKTRLQELAESIKKNGIINPINVSKTKDGYELVSGERRLLAHRLAKIKKIKAIVRELTKEENIAHTIVENIHRVDLSEWEKATSVRKLINSKYKPKQIREMLGISEKEYWSNIF